MKEAMYYKKSTDGHTECILCPHNCKIPPGKAGLCRVRKNRGGTLFSESYGQISSIALDPIQKKPIYHFYPGSAILSAGSYGCNLKCPNCQNYGISMEHPSTEYVSPDTLLEYALKLKDKGNIGIY